jgi:hypothetical protein
VQERGPFLKEPHDKGGFKTNSASKKIAYQAIFSLANSWEYEISSN